MKNIFLDADLGEKSKNCIYNWQMYTSARIDRSASTTVLKVCSPRVDRVFPKNPYLIRKPTEIVLCAHSIAIIIILVSFVTDRMIIKYTLCMIQDQEIMKLYGQNKKFQDLDPKIVLTYSPTSK